MGAIGEMTLEDAAREAAGNWRSWTCFVWDREREIDDAENWSIVYTHNRDSGLLAQSNAAAIADVLRPFSETKNPDVVFESHAHWAVGHVDGRAGKSGDTTDPARPENVETLDHGSSETLSSLVRSRDRLHVKSPRWCAARSQRDHDTEEMQHPRGF